MSYWDDYWFDLGYAKGAASRDAEIATLSEQVKMLEKERDYYAEQATMFRDVAKGVTQQLMIQQTLVEAVVATEPKP